MVEDSDGTYAVRWARGAIDRHLGDHRPPDPAEPLGSLPPPPPVFAERRGVFVSLHRWPRPELRGCIGFPLPHFPLKEGLPRAAVAAATEDPRFPPVERRELPGLRIEVSLLTVPELLRVPQPEDLPSAVVVGRDGLIVDGGGTSGLLLPQVASELGWDARTFLDETCLKAGLSRDAWLDRGVRVRAFSAEVFQEERPGGPVHREALTATGEAAVSRAGAPSRRT